MQNIAKDGFIPGIRLALIVSDIEESFRDYDENTYFGKKMSPNIEFHIGITNDAFLKYRNYYLKSISEAEKVKKKKYAETMKARAEQLILDQVRLIYWIKLLIY